MAKLIKLESFTDGAARRRAPPPPPPPVEEPPAPETTETYALGYEAGYAAGAAAAASEHATLLAMASEAFERVAADRSEIEKRCARDAAGLARAGVAAIGPTLLSKEFVALAVAELESVIDRAAQGQAVAATAPETRLALREAFAEHPKLADVEVVGEDGLDRFAVRFAWRDGLAEVDAAAALSSVLEVIDTTLAEASAAEPAPQSPTADQPT